MLYILDKLRNFSSILSRKLSQSVQGLQVNQLLFNFFHSLEAQEFVVDVDDKGFGGASVVALSGNEHTLQRIEVLFSEVQ